ncbi:hypothetical protein L0U88_12895 [Flavihumibacter sp. RY-1]|uniref:Uncharacterized protein n=1 Tax=Flavihumibacter fluminis TaxID=2909236 RepID=A0ABS9BIG9_9BACT|nr:hypothetical protein [Flavihumibacter fluminis]MCF1715527.1 hypothetical protein [Flavihumibacter fluminis]
MEEETKGMEERKKEEGGRVEEHHAHLPFPLSSLPPASLPLLHAFPS